MNLRHAKNGAIFWATLYYGIRTRGTQRKVQKTCKKNKK